LPTPPAKMRALVVIMLKKLFTPNIWNFLIGNHEYCKASKIDYNRRNSVYNK